MKLSPFLKRSMSGAHQPACGTSSSLMICVWILVEVHFCSTVVVEPTGGDEVSIFVCSYEI